MSTNSDGMLNCQIGKEDTDSVLGDLKAGTPLINYGINDVLNPGLGTPKFIDDHFDNAISTLQTDSITDNSDADPLIGSSNHHHSDSLGHSSHDLQPINAANDTLVQPVSDLPHYIDALLPANRPRWNSGSPFGTPVTITFSFMESRPSYAPSDWTNFNVFTAEQRAFARQALQLYADVANINFVEVSDAGGGGTMRFGYASRPGAAGWAFYPSSAASGGDVWMSNSRSDLTQGSLGFTTLLHEIGHALGIKHPHDGSVTLPASQDSDQYTLMSYNKHPNMPNVEPTTPQLFDVATIQYLYGANTSTRTGNNTYSWGTNANFIQTIWDGGGTDTISAANQTRNAFINLNAGSFSSIGAYGASNATNNVAIAYGVTIENATGGSGNDTIYGNGVANFLRGGDGNDYLWGADSNDTLYGENGDDTLSGGDDNDYLWSGNGNDDLYGGNGNDTLYSGEGNDYLSGGDGNDYLYDWGGNSSLYGGNGNDYLSSGNGDDYLDGGTGNDSMYGGAGNDRYIVDSTGDVVTEYNNQGTDTVYSSIGYTLGDNLENLYLTGTANIYGYGNSLNNYISGNSGNNYLWGADGNDTLHSGNGNDTLSGGDGNDYLSSGAGNDTLYGGTGNDTMYGGAGNDYLYAWGSNSYIYGEEGNDTLYGGSGNDYLDGGIGNDSMYGGADNDRYIVDSTGDVVTEYANQGTDSVYSSISYTLGDNLENLYLTGTANIYGYGNSLDNYISGNSGDNYLWGAEGNDTLYGGNGNDTVHGGDGDDYLSGGAGDDTVYGGTGNNTLSGGTGNDYLYAWGSNSYIYGEEGNDTLYGWSGDDYLSGGSGDDYLSSGIGNDSMYGGIGDDSMYGGIGNDYLDGGSGNDSMYGGAGNDSYIVDSVGDVVIEYADQGIDTLYSSVSYTLGDYIENLIFTSTSTTSAIGNSLDNEITGNSGINVLSGGAGNDTLRGEGGNDNLDGGEGNDLLIGGSGYDILTGGLNADTFAFSSTGDEFDIITDFTIEQGDLIQVSASGFGGGLVAGILTESQFWLGSAATTADHRFIYNDSTGGLFFDVDGVGENAQVQFATLSTGLTLTNSSILVAA